MADIDPTEAEREAVRLFMDREAWTDSGAGVLGRVLAGGVRFEVADMGGTYRWRVESLGNIVGGGELRDAQLDTQEAAMQAAWNAFKGYWLLKALRDRDSGPAKSEPPPPWMD